MGHCNAPACTRRCRPVNTRRRCYPRRTRDVRGGGGEKGQGGGELSYTDSIWRIWLARFARFPPSAVGRRIFTDRRAAAAEARRRLPDRKTASPRTVSEAQGRSSSWVARAKAAGCRSQPSSASQYSIVPRRRASLSVRPALHRGHFESARLTFRPSSTCGRRALDEMIMTSTSCSNSRQSKVAKIEPPWAVSRDRAPPAPGDHLQRGG